MNIFLDNSQEPILKRRRIADDKEETTKGIDFIQILVKGGGGIHAQSLKLVPCRHFISIFGMVAQNKYKKHHEKK